MCFAPSWLSRSGALLIYSVTVKRLESALVAGYELYRFVLCQRLAGQRSGSMQPRYTRATEVDLMEALLVSARWELTDTVAEPYDAHVTRVVPREHWSAVRYGVAEDRRAASNVQVKPLLHRRYSMLA